MEYAHPMLDEHALQEKHAQAKKRMEAALQTEYLLIEHGEPLEPATVTRFDTKAQRMAATMELLWPEDQAMDKDDVACWTDQHKLLAEGGLLTFEGDPPIQWLDAVLVTPNVMSTSKTRNKQAAA